jgi:hypothetical protein
MRKHVAVQRENAMNGCLANDQSFADAAGDAHARTLRDLKTPRRF